MINAHSTPEVTPSLSSSAWSSGSARAAPTPRIGLALAGLWFAAAIGCVPTNARVIVTPPPDPPGEVATAAPAPAPAAASAKPITFQHHDDVPAAMARASAENKAVFVDVWAPWCHTCLSMQAYVLGDPSLGAFADRVIFVAVDSDKPENAAFLERYAVSSWPTFFLLDPGGKTGPQDERLLGYWPGAASLTELRTFVDEGLRGMGSGKPAGGDQASLASAHAAFAGRDFAGAAGLYERLVTRESASPRRSEALLGWIRSTYSAKDWAACASIGQKYVNEVTGAALPADFSSYAFTCAGKLPAGPEQAALRAAVIARLRELVRRPPVDASPDDRADALAILAEALAETGDRDGARAANQARLGLMERAAAEAPAPEVAATYDYQRAGAYLALGRPDDAVRMLVQRERELPKSYEPPARLADVLVRVGRLPEALKAIDRAIARAYGPRRLRYLKLRAEIQDKLGDRAAQIATLREEVAGHEALARGHANLERLAEAKKRLEEAERAALPLPSK